MVAVSLTCLRRLVSNYIRLGIRQEYTILTFILISILSSFLFLSSPKGDIFRATDNEGDVNTLGNAAMLHSTISGSDDLDNDDGGR